MGDATATDTTTNSSVTLNEVDPDSLSIDAQGKLYVVDGAKNATYIIRSTFKPGTIFTELPSDSGTIAGNPAGAFANYQISSPTATPFTLTKS